MNKKIEKILAIILVVIMAMGSIAAAVEPNLKEPADVPEVSTSDTSTESEVKTEVKTEEEKPEVNTEEEKPVETSETVTAAAELFGLKGDKEAFADKLSELMPGAVLSEEEINSLVNAADEEAFNTVLKAILAKLLPAETAVDELLTMASAAFTAKFTELTKPAEEVETQEEKPEEPVALKFNELTAEEQFKRFEAFESEEEMENALNSLTAEQLDAFRNYALTQGLDMMPLPEINVTGVSQPAHFLPPVGGFNPLVRMMNAEEPENGLILGKNVSKNPDENGNYKVSLDAFVTGNIQIEAGKAVPADVVLVLDVSGSMNDYMKVGDVNNTDALDKEYGKDPGTYEYYATVAWRNVRYNEEAQQWEYYYPYWPEEGWYKLDEANKGGDIRITRMNALRIAVKRFCDQMYNKALGPDGIPNTPDDVDHKISLVKFAGDNTSSVGNSTYSGYNYSQIVVPLGSALEKAGSIKNKISEIYPGGATSADYGMAHAKNIINGIAPERESNRVVIMFTDGEPNHGNGFSDTVADSAISQAKEIKNSGASVYTVGVFANADDSVPMPAGASKANKYMHYVSSNFANASSLSEPGEATYPEGGKSFYLAADNAQRLANIFSEISADIETGGASMKLGSETAVRDTITSKFIMPANTQDIKVYTEDYLGYDEVGNRKFGNKKVYDNAVIALDPETKAIEVSNFDFSNNENCVTDTTKGDKVTYSGKRLVIEFDIKADPGFLGGNYVPTNGPDSGVYNGEFSEMFPQPAANVPVKKIELKSETQNIYLSNKIDLAKLLADKDAKLTGENNSHVDITYTLKEKNGTIVAKYVVKRGQTSGTVHWLLDSNAAPSETAEYILDCEISAGGSNKANSNSTATVNVYKPELTFKDSKIFLGDTANYDDNFVKVEWKHNGVLADNKMGTAPELSYTYTPAASAFENDTPVKVQVSAKGKDISSGATFYNKTELSNNDPAFTVFVQGGTLTINKAGTVSPSEGFIFTVTKQGDNSFKRVVSVKGNGKAVLTNLPAGSYTVEEDTSWSWKYSSAVSGTAAISAATPTAAVTVTNTAKPSVPINSENTVQNINKPVVTTTPTA